MIELHYGHSLGCKFEKRSALHIHVLNLSIFEGLLSYDIFSHHNRFFNYKVANYSRRVKPGLLNLNTQKKDKRTGQMNRANIDS